MSKTILVVDDEEAIVEILEMNLRREGFQVLTAYRGEDAVERVRQSDPDLVLLDVGLPDMDGFQVCRKMRAFSNVPVIMVTARGDDVDKIVGLEGGADDYVVKPFNPKELVARVNAILRRTDGGRSTSTKLSYRELEIDLLRRRVTVGGQQIELTPKEHDLLTFLVSRQGDVLPREEILREVWGSEHLDARSVDVHIRYLREKLGKNASKYVRTVWGKGYRFGDE
ncbi:MAG: response regulator transcription factor [Armatimonadetes bacterium]|nr:response regulator transcription factor [Armatimonadota bacterium]